MCLYIGCEQLALLFPATVTVMWQSFDKNVTAHKTFHHFLKMSQKCHACFIPVVLVFVTQLSQTAVTICARVALALCAPLQEDTLRRGVPVCVR